MSPVARTCVPPHSSTLKPGIDTTRTRSPYFSPKSAIAPAAIASSVERTSVCTGVLRYDLLVDDALDRIDLLARDRREVHEVEPQAIGRDERSRLLDVRAEHLAQRRVQQVRRGVIAPRRVAHRVVDLRGDDLSTPEPSLFDADLVETRPSARLPEHPLDDAPPPSAPTSRPVSETWPPASR